MKKIKNAIVLILGVLIIFWASPSHGADIIDQLQKQVAFLLEQIQILQNQLQELASNQQQGISDSNYQPNSNQENAIISACFEKNIERGMSDSEIISLQSVLKEDASIYPEGLVTGYFGPLTQKALSNFQDKYSISEASNFIGPKTREKLNQIYCPAQITSNDSPLNLSINPLSSGQLELNWTDEFFYKFHSLGGDYGFLIKIADEACNSNASFRELARVDGNKDSQGYKYLVPKLTKTGDYCFYVVGNDGFKYYISNKVSVVYWSPDDSSIGKTDEEIPTISSSETLKAPTNLSFEIGDDYKISLSWANNNSEEGVKNMIMLNSDCEKNSSFINIGSVGHNISSFTTDFTLSDDNSYCFKVGATLGDLSAYSDQIFIEKRLPGPKAPIILSIDSSYFDKTIISWADSSYNEDGFRVERRGNYESAFLVLANLKANDVSYTDYNVEPGKVYTYRVSAYNDLGENHSHSHTITTPYKRDDGGDNQPEPLKAIISTNYTPLSSPSREHEIARFNIANNQIEGNKSLFVSDIKWVVNGFNLSEGVSHQEITRKFSLYKEEVSLENKISEFVLVCPENINCFKDGVIDFRVDSLSSYRLISQKNIVSPVEILPAEIKTFIIVANTTIPRVNSMSDSYWEAQIRDDDIFCIDGEGMNVPVEGLPISNTANW